MAQARSSALDIHANCLATRVHRLDRQLQALYDDALRPLGVRSTQLALLAAIHASPGARAAAVANHLALDRSTLSRTLGTLESQGWLVRRPLGLTDAGRDKLREAWEPWQQAQFRARVLLGGQSVPGL